MAAWSNAKSVAALSVVALALGIGWTTAIFTVTKAVLLKPLGATGRDVLSLVVGSGIKLAGFGVATGRALAAQA